jgi:hypothetical protein
MKNIFNKLITGFYLIVFIFFLIFISDTLISANLYTTSGYIVFNSIFFISLILIFIFAIFNTQLTISNLKKNTPSIL